MDPIDHFVADVEAAQAQAALRTLEGLGYTYHGGDQWKPPLGPVPDLAKLSPEQELRWVLQAIADPENQPSQFGTVTIAHMDAYAAEAVKQERERIMAWVRIYTGTPQDARAEQLYANIAKDQP